MTEISTTERISLIDNMKILLIFLVIFGHLIEPLIWKNEFIKTIYMSIYSFHMPMFAFISGTLSKGRIENGWVKKAVLPIAKPLVVFTFFYELYELITHGNFSGYTQALQPYWILWFMYSLLVWRLILPFVGKFKSAVLFSIAIAIAASFLIHLGYFLGLSRTLIFFPFFLFGYQVKPYFVAQIDKIKTNIGILPFVFVLALVVIGFYLFRSMQPQWLYGSLSFPRLGVTGVYAVTVRSAIYVISALTILSVSVLIPSQYLQITKLGEQSLYIYLWHGFIVKALVGIHAIERIGNHGTMVSLFSLFVISLLIMKVLSGKPVVDFTKKILIF